MGRAKEIELKVLPAKIANEFIKENHYSRKVVQNSSLHLGAFLDNRLHGVLSFGSPLDKRKVLNNVLGPDGNPCSWNDMLELNRMAFDDQLPKNSESRCIAIAVRMIKKNAPNVKWILSFSDALQCGDGAIYRACGFDLVSIKPLNDFYELPTGEVIMGTTLRISGYTSWLIPYMTKDEFIATTNGGNRPYEALKKIGAVRRPGGFSMKYILILDKSCKIAMDRIPFAKIDELNAGMYKGKKVSLSERRQSFSKNAGVAQLVECPAIQPGYDVRIDPPAPLKQA